MVSMRVSVSINTEEDWYPQIGIRSVEQEGVDARFGYEIPRELLEAYNQANEAVAAAEDAILRAAGFTYDNVNGWIAPPRKLGE